MNTEIQTTVSTNQERRITLRARLKKMEGDEKSVREQMLEYLRENSEFENPEDLIELFDAWFAKAYQKPRQPGSSEAVKKMVANGLAQVKKKIEAVAEYSFLAMPMPNGKLLGDCTFAQVRDYGGKTLGPFLKRLSGMGSPRQVVKTVFTEEQLFDIFRTSGSLNSPRPRKKG